MSIHLISVIPHEGQANRWTETWRDRYYRTLELSRDVITLADRYTPDCFHIRNRYLIDHADQLLALYNGNPNGGTAFTVRYAKQRNKEITIINPCTLERSVIVQRLQESSTNVITPL